MTEMPGYIDVNFLRGVNPPVAAAQAVVVAEKELASIMPDFTEDGYKDLRTQAEEFLGL